ncbi:MAG: ATPase [Muribaculaceae bacterium]|nr:ATPase [Muribaculaceae bacterium]
MQTILLADAGASKTDWSLIEKGSGVIMRVKTEGINPLHLSTEKIEKILNDLKNSVDGKKIDIIRFFGAGCNLPEINQQLEDLFSQIFQTEDVTIASDMQAAALALFQDKKGVACILGTGSNTCYYDKGKIISQIPSLGYILGDEGSGVALGKRLLNAIFKKQLSDKIADSFYKQYDISLNLLIDKVYRDGSPAAFIASFSPFILQHIRENEIYKLAYDEFSLFFERNVLPYPLHQRKVVGLSGSVAFHYADIIRKVADEKDIVISDIIEGPMKSLENYYSK